MLVDDADIDWLQPFRNEVHRGVRYGKVHLVEAAIALEHRSGSNRLLTHLGQDDELFAREIQLFDSLSKDDLRSAVRVHLESYALDMQNADK